MDVVTDSPGDGVQSNRVHGVHLKHAAVVILAVMAGAFFSGLSATQTTASAAVTPDIPGVVTGGTKIEVVASVLRGAEGAIAAPDGTLLVTEQSANRVSRLDASGRITPYLSNTNGAAGLAFDHNGRLIAAQTINPQIAVLSPTRDVLADSIEGMPIMRPNDLTIDRNGGIYFTDPGPPVPPEEIADLPRKPAVYYVRSETDIVRLADDIERPTGVLLNTNEKVLYVANGLGDSVLAFDVRPDGTVTNRRSFARLNGMGADGLAVDAEGRLYAATPSGVQIFSAQGRSLGTIPIPDGHELAFAGADKKTLYVVSRNTVWKIAMVAAGIGDRAK